MVTYVVDNSAFFSPGFKNIIFDLLEKNKPQLVTVKKGRVHRVTNYAQVYQDSDVPLNFSKLLNSKITGSTLFVFTDLQYDASQYGVNKNKKIVFVSTDRTSKDIAPYGYTINFFDFLLRYSHA